MFESQNSQMQLIWLAGQADHQARLQTQGTDVRTASAPVLGRAFAALRRLATRPKPDCAAACGMSSSLQACC